MTASTQELFTSSLPELYERFLVAPLFRPFAEDLLRRVGVNQHERLLDVACGTGIVARLAQPIVGVHGRVVGIDASPAMLAQAKAIAPAVDWRKGDAAHLPVADGDTFDVVTCHQGLQFFVDKAAALKEMHRVLTPHGRLAIGTWAAVSDIPLMRALHTVAERHLGAVVDVRHSMGDPDAIRQLLGDAGFGSIQVDQVTRTIRMNDDVFPRLNAMAIVGMSPSAKTMADATRTEVMTAIANESVDVARPYLDG